MTDDVDTSWNPIRGEVTGYALYGRRQVRRRKHWWSLRKRPVWEDYLLGHGPVDSTEVVQFESGGFKIRLTSPEEG